MTRAVWVGLIAVVVAVAVMAVRSPNIMTVDVAVAEQGTLRSYVDDEAKTRVPELYTITMPLQGRILPIKLREGDSVSAGQVVARMEPLDLDADLTEARNVLVQADKTLDVFDNAIEQIAETILASRAKLDFSKRNLERNIRLMEQNAVSEKDKEDAELLEIESRVDLRKDQLDDINYRLMRSIIELYRQTQAERERKANRDRQRADITSPVDGVVLSRSVSNERVLPPGEVLMEIGRIDQLEVETDLLTRDVASVRINDPAEIMGPAIGETPVPGRVARIFPRGFTKMSSLGVEQQRVKTIIAFDAETQQALVSGERQLGVDFRVHVRIYTDEEPQAIKVPRSALFRSSTGAWRTFVVRQGVARLTDVQIGLSNDQEVQVVAGVAEGDSVVLAPESSLVDGQPVEARVLRRAASNVD